MSDESANNRIVGKEKREKLTFAMCEELHHHKDRANITFSDLSKAIDLHGKLTESVVLRWFRGGVQRVNKDHFDLVLEQLKALPSSSCVAIDLGVREKLKNYQIKTGVGPEALLNSGENPYGITSTVIYWWMNGGIRKKQKVEKAHLDFVFQRWEEILLSQNYKIPLDAGVRDELQFHMTRTDMTRERFLKQATDKPEGLVASLILYWLRGDVNSVRKDHLDYVLEGLKEIPDKNTPEYSEHLAVLLKEENDASKKLVLVCGEKRGLLLRHKERTGISASKLLRIGTAVPEGLTPQEINSWLFRNGQSADPEHIEFVSRLWASLPDKPGRKVTPMPEITREKTLNKKNKKQKRKARKKCNEIVAREKVKARKDLLGKKEKLKKSYQNRLAKQQERSDKETAREFARQKAQAAKEELARLAVIALAEDQVQEEKKEALQKRMTTLQRDTRPYEMIPSGEMKKALLSQQKRTGYSPKEIVAAFPDLPVKTATINKWISSETDMVKTAHYDAVLAAWRTLPTANYVLIDKKYLQLHEEKIHDLELLNDTPIGLNLAIIDGWLRGTVKTAKSYHWDYVVSKLGKHPN